MEQKLNFLRKFNNGNVNLVSTDEVRNIDSSKLPNDWFIIFGEEDNRIRKDILLELWKKYSATELRNTISYLNEYLEDIEIIEVNGRYSILYSITNLKGMTLYYEGRNPLDTFNNEELENVWEKIPDGIRKFYENVHNGFYYYASESMGLVPLESVTYFEDYEWGIIEDLEEPMKIDLKTTFGFFSNGMGTYVAIDYQNCSDDNATLWSAKKQPRYDINFWDVVDEWIVIGFQ